jgi:hypothetical protein
MCSGRSALRTHLLALSLAPWSATAFAATPEQVTRDFYQWAIHGQSGHRDEAGLQPVKSLLSHKLYFALAAVAQQEEICESVVPTDTKPFIIDGDPWYFYQQDGAKKLVSTAAHAGAPDAIKVDARLRYDASMEWTDTVVLANESGRWVIADIRFEQGGSLTQALHSYATEAVRECGMQLHAPIPPSPPPPAPPAPPG